MKMPQATQPIPAIYAISNADAQELAQKLPVDEYRYISARRGPEALSGHRGPVYITMALIGDRHFDALRRQGAISMASLSLEERAQFPEGYLK